MVPNRQATCGQATRPNPAGAGLACSQVNRNTLRRGMGNGVRGAGYIDLTFNFFTFVSDNRLVLSSEMVTRNNFFDGKTALN
jgi:hypothetical protein